MAAIKELVKKTLPILIIVGFTLFFVRGLIQGPLIWGDAPYVSSASKDLLLDNFLYTWSSSNFGTVPRMSFGTALPLSLTLIPGMPDQVIYFFLNILPIFFLALCSYVVILKLTGNKKISTVISLFSIANPVLLGDIHNGQTLWIYPILFLLIYYCIKLFFYQNYEIGNIVITAILIFCALGVLPPIIVPLATCLIIFCVIAFAKNVLKEPSSLYSYIVYGTSILLFTFLLCFPYLQIVSSGQEGYQAPSTTQDYFHNYSRTFPLNTLIFAGNEGNGQSVLGFNFPSLTNYFGYFLLVIFLLGFLQVIKQSNFPETWRLILISSISVVATVWGVIIFLTLNKAVGALLFQEFFLIGTIRNPTKLFLISFIFFLIAFAFSLIILAKPLKQTWKKNIFFALIVLVICIYSWPVFRGDLGMFYERDRDSVAKNLLITEIIESIHSYSGRSIIIPSTHADELQFQSIDKKLNTLRLGGHQPLTKKYVDDMIDSFNKQDGNLFKTSTDTGNIETIILKKPPYYANGSFGIFPTKISFQDARQLLQTNFKIARENESFIVFINNEVRDNIFSLNHLFITPPNDSAKKLYGQFIKDELKQKFYYSDSDDVVVPGQSLSGLFSQANLILIKNNAITFESKPGTYLLYTPNRTNVATALDGVILRSSSSESYGHKSNRLTFLEPRTITYQTDHLLENVVVNGSFENSLWQKDAEDCNAYDDRPILDMRTSSNAYKGAVALELSATTHIACTNQQVALEGGNKYHFSFAYQSHNAQEAGYYIGYTIQTADGATTTSISEQVPIKGEDWQEFNKIIEVPDGAVSAALYFYSFSKDGVTPIITRYDDVHLVKLPDDIFDYWLLSDPGVEIVEPREVTFEIINPTKKVVHVKGATTPFYLAMSESYHPQWQLQMNNEKIHGWLQGWVPWVTPDRVPDEHHFKLNGFLNGWYVDTQNYCDTQKLCVKNGDGSYDIEFTIEFFPQRWFYIGLLISGTTFMGCIGFLLYDILKRRNRRREQYVEKHYIN